MILKIIKERNQNRLEKVYLTDRIIFKISFDYDSFVFFIYSNTLFDFKF